MESSGVAVIFEQDDPFDVLLKHGPSDKIESLFLSDTFDRLAKTGCRLVMVTVPPSCCDTLNKCLSISASKWCSRLMDEANAEADVSPASGDNVRPLVGGVV